MQAFGVLPLHAGPFDTVIFTGIQLNRHIFISNVKHKFRHAVMTSNNLLFITWLPPSQMHETCITQCCNCPSCDLRKENHKHLDALQMWRPASVHFSLARRQIFVWAERIFRVSRHGQSSNDQSATHLACGLTNKRHPFYSDKCPLSSFWHALLLQARNDR